MNLTKSALVTLASNLAILANVFVGFLGVHWLVVVAFIALHGVLRIAYVKQERQKQTSNPERTQTVIAPPMVLYIASGITAVILAIALYGIGFGVRALLN